MIPFTGRQFPLLPPYTLLAQKRFKSENFKVQSQLLYMECHDLSALKNFGLKFWKMLLLLAFCTPPPLPPFYVQCWTMNNFSGRVCIFLLSNIEKGNMGSFLWVF